VTREAFEVSTSRLHRQVKKLGWFGTATRMRKSDSIYRSHSADLINEGTFGVMMAARGDLAVPVPLVDVAGYKKLVPTDLPV